MPEIESKTFKSFYSKVAGVSHANSNRTSRQKIIRDLAKLGMPLQFEREPDNKFDKNAVAVWIETSEGRKQIGYLDSHTAEQVAGDLENGIPWYGIITDITGGSDDKPTRGVNIFLSQNEEEVKANKPRSSGCLSILIFFVLASLSGTLLLFS